MSDVPRGNGHPPAMVWHGMDEDESAKTAAGMLAHVASGRKPLRMNEQGNLNGSVHPNSERPELGERIEVAHSIHKSRKNGSASSRATLPQQTPILKPAIREQSSRGKVDEVNPQVQNRVSEPSIGKEKQRIDEGYRSFEHGGYVVGNAQPATKNNSDAKVADNEKQKSAGDSTRKIVEGSASKNKTLNYEDMEKYFHLPINLAAKELGICMTVLKKHCRRFGIARWPHRRLKSLDNMVERLETEGADAVDKEYFEHELDSLRQRKAHMLRSFCRNANNSANSAGGAEQPSSGANAQSTVENTTDPTRQRANGAIRGKSGSSQQRNGSAARNRLAEETSDYTDNSSKMAPAQLLPSDDNRGAMPGSGIPPGANYGMTENVGSRPYPQQLRRPLAPQLYQRRQTTSQRSDSPSQETGGSLATRGAPQPSSSHVSPSLDGNQWMGPFVSTGIPPSRLTHQYGLTPRSPQFMYQYASQPSAMQQFYARYPPGTRMPRGIAEDVNPVAGFNVKPGYPSDRSQLQLPLVAPDADMMPNQMNMYGWTGRGANENGSLVNSEAVSNTPWSGMGQMYNPSVDPAAFVNRASGQKYVECNCIDCHKARAQRHYNAFGEAAMQQQQYQSQVPMGIGQQMAIDTQYRDELAESNPIAAQQFALQNPMYPYMFGAPMNVSAEELTANELSYRMASLNRFAPPADEFSAPQGSWRCSDPNCNVQHSYVMPSNADDGSREMSRSGMDSSQIIREDEAQHGYALNQQKQDSKTADGRDGTPDPKNNSSLKSSAEASTADTQRLLDEKNGYSLNGFRNVPRSENPPNAARLYKTENVDARGTDLQKDGRSGDPTLGSTTVTRKSLLKHAMLESPTPNPWEPTDETRSGPSSGSDSGDGVGSGRDPASGNGSGDGGAGSGNGGGSGSGDGTGSGDDDATGSGDGFASAEGTGSGSGQSRDQFIKSVAVRRNAPSASGTEMGGSFGHESLRNSSRNLVSMLTTSGNNKRKLKSHSGSDRTSGRQDKQDESASVSYHGANSKRPRTDRAPGDQDQLVHPEQSTVQTQPFSESQQQGEIGSLINPSESEKTKPAYKEMPPPSRDPHVWTQSPSGAAVGSRISDRTKLSAVENQLPTETVGLCRSLELLIFALDRNQIVTAAVGPSSISPVPGVPLKVRADLRNMIRQSIIKQNGAQTEEKIEADLEMALKPYKDAEGGSAPVERIFVDSESRKQFLQVIRPLIGEGGDILGTTSMCMDISKSVVLSAFQTADGSRTNTKEVERTLTEKPDVRDHAETIEQTIVGEQATEVDA